MGLIGRHAHKDKLGYKANHDTLMAMHPVNRAKLITYFIAANTKVKLDPNDREIFSKNVNAIQKNANTIGIAGFFASVIGARFAKKSYIYSTIAGLAAGCITRSVYMNHAETQFVFESELIRNLALKYQFSLFDFHNSKKEAQIGHLAAEILSEDPSMANTYPD